jgi:hypothetical protein
MFREIKLRRDNTFEVFKGRQRSKSSHRGQVQVENAKSFWPEILERSERTVRFLRGEVPKSRGPLDLIDLWEG